MKHCLTYPALTRGDEGCSRASHLAVSGSIKDGSRRTKAIAAPIRSYMVGRGVQGMSNKPCALTGFGKAGQRSAHASARAAWPMPRYGIPMVTAQNQTRPNERARPRLARTADVKGLVPFPAGAGPAQRRVPAAGALIPIPATAIAVLAPAHATSTPAVDPTFTPTSLLTPPPPRGPIAGAADAPSSLTKDSRNV